MDLHELVAWADGSNLTESIDLALNHVMPPMIEIGRNLTFSFAAILLMFVGVRMMMERNNTDQILFGDALKVFFLLGLALGLLENYLFLRDLLTESVDYIILQVGGGKSVIGTVLHNFLIAPLQMMDEIDATRSAAPGHTDGGGIMDLIGSMWDWITIEIGNIIDQIGLWLLVGMFFLWALLSCIYIIVYIALAAVLLGIILVFGPLCIPFLMVPKLDKIMWSWLDGVLYALVLKITVMVCLILAGNLLPAAFEGFVHVDDMGAIDVDWMKMFPVAGMLLLTLAMVRSAFQVAGIISGTRLAINPKLSLKG